MVEGINKNDSMCMIMQIQTMMKQQNQLNQVSPQKLLKGAQKTRGYLEKKSRGFFSTWQKRYFIILNQTLMYYTDEALDQRKGVIDFKDILNISSVDELQFNLETKERTYEFKSDTKDNRDLWVASLRLLKDQNFFIKSIKHSTTRKKQVSKNRKKLQIDKNTLQMLEKGLGWMGLENLKEKISRPVFYNRVFCTPHKKGFYILISIKSLEFSQVDDLILEEQYVRPFDFNRLYEVGEKTVTDIGKMSEMLYCKMGKQFIYVSFKEDQEVCIPIKKQSEAYEITRIFKRAYDVGKEYYNPYKIKLNKNIDMLTHLYDSNLKSFEKYIEDKVLLFFRRFLSSKETLCKCFLNDLQSLKKCLLQLEEAFRVSTPFREDAKNYLFKVCHQVITKQLSKAWEVVFHYISFRQVLLYSYWVYEYWLIINPLIPDNRLIEGVTDLTRIYLKKMGLKIKAQIQSIKIEKAQIRKLKTDAIQNQITSAFLEWLKEIKGQLSESVPVEAVFNEYAKFFCRIFTQLSDYLTEVSEKWNEPNILIGGCNDLSKIKKYFETQITQELCKGLISHAKYLKTCGDKVSTQLNGLIQNLIRKIFILSFGSIDGKILNKSFLDLNVGKICYEVLQRIQPIKKRVNEYIEHKIIMLSFDEICFFVYTCFVKKPQIQGSPSMIKQAYVKALEKAITDIEQFYSNKKTEQQVKIHLKQMLVLKEFLLCHDFMVPKQCLALKKVFSYSFNEQILRNLLKIRNSEQKLLSQCLQTLKNNSSDGEKTETVSFEHLDSWNTRSRKSTLTASLYEKYTIELINLIKKGKQGKLSKKTLHMVKDSHYQQAYFKISNGNLCQYANQKCNKIIDMIPLRNLQKCSLDSEKQNVINLDTMGQCYRLKAANRDEAGKWVQAIYAELGHPLFDNRMGNTSPGKKQPVEALFKDLEEEPPTTTTLKKNLIEEKNAELSKEKRYKKRQKSIEKSSEVRKPKKLKKAEDEGSCCSNIFF